MTNGNKLDEQLVALLQQDVFTALGLDDLDDTERHELLATMLATVKDRVLARVLDALSVSERAELTQLINRGPAEVVSEWLAEHVPNLDALMTEEALIYKAEMVQNARQIRQLLGQSVVSSQ